MPYAILVSYESRARDREWEPVEGLIFENGAEAGDYVKAENAYSSMYAYGRRYKAIKLTDEDPLLWRQRLEKQLESGVLHRVPWHDYYVEKGYCSTGLYEHIDPNDQTKVRYVASATDGMQGRYTSMTPGRFIKHYVDSYCDASLLDEWCAKMGLELTTSPLMLARKPEEIVWVYNNGPHSCMAYDMSGPTFEKVDKHPVSVYGDSDLALAYIMRRGEITARALCWPEKKIFGRIYGDRSRLLERFKENDYIENWMGLAGAKIRQLRNEEDKRLILPYIDGDLGVIPEGDDWLILSDKPHIIAKSPYGIVEADSCNRCGATGVWLEAHREDEDDEPEYICAEGCN